MRKIPAVAVNHFYSACGAPHFSGKSLLMLLKKKLLCSAVHLYIYAICLYYLKFVFSEIRIKIPANYPILFSIIFTTYFFP